MATDFGEGDARLAEADEYPEVEDGDERQTEGDEDAGDDEEVPEEGQHGGGAEDGEDGGDVRAVGVGRAARRWQRGALMVLLDVAKGVGEGIGGRRAEMEARRWGVVAGHGFAEVDVDGDLAALRVGGVQPAAQAVAFVKPGGGGFAQHDFQPDGIRVGTATDDGNGVGLSGAQLGDVGPAPVAEASAIAVKHGETIAVAGEHGRGQRTRTEVAAALPEQIEGDERGVAEEDVEGVGQLRQVCAGEDGADAEGGEYAHAGGEQVDVGVVGAVVRAVIVSAVHAVGGSQAGLWQLYVSRRRGGMRQADDARPFRTEAKL